MDGVACVEICGPLTQHFTFGLDSYDAIGARFQRAAATDAHTVLLKISSPGGDVHGVFELARAMRAGAAAAGKRLVAYVDGTAASAAYALACAADEIIVPATGCVGSIGVIDTLSSLARQDAAMGVDVALVTSGARKADGNPHAPLSDASLAACQQHVDELAAVFFDWVADRRGLDLKAISGFEGGIFIGERAIAAGLVDSVDDYQALHGKLTRATISMAATKSGEPPAMKRTFTEVMAMITSALAGGAQASKYTDAMAALAALAEEGDEDAKKAMKKMLSPAKAEDSEPAKDNKDGEKAKAGKDCEDPKAQAAAAVKAAGEALAESTALRAELARRDEVAERAQLLAARPDLTADPATRTKLEAMPIGTLRAVLEVTPKAQFKAPAQVNPTQGSDTKVGMPEDQAKSLRVRMGLDRQDISQVTHGPNFQAVFGGTPDQVQRAITAPRFSEKS